MLSLYVGLISAAVALALGGWLGVEWQQGRDAIAHKAAQEEIERVRKDSEAIALTHANNTAELATQLGDTRAKLRSLTTGRDCLSAAAVRLLNTPAATVPAAAGQPASAPAAAATDQDVGDALAICRSQYSKLSDQLNSILDIEESRQ